jgi:hypothetical protein
MRMLPGLTLIVGLSLSACEDSIDPERPGTLVVSTSTTGEDPDQDGYLLVVDDVDSLDLASTASTELEVAPGRHTLRLLGVAGQCSVSPGATLEVDASSSTRTPVAFAVSCSATGVRVTVATSGLDVDLDGYHVAADDNDRAAIDRFETILILLESGNRTIALTGLAPNCAVDGLSSRTVNVVVGQVTPIEFAVTCTATSGVIVVVVSGDVEGIPFELTFDGARRSPLVSGESRYLTWVPVGDHVVSLSALGCTVATNPQSVSIASGGLTRDTVTVSFSATCLRTGRLHITAPTTGPVPDTRFEVWTCSGNNCFYDFAHFVGKVRPNGVLNATHNPGTYHIWMYLPDNCLPQFNGFDKQFTLARGDTVRVELPVACS